ncbi:MAG TPA: hypothetical protein VHD56_19725 [Tepidisphaeraceae bacterium]|nr:hypothetical protein [Tepidisphaeraceae bacterium]
MNSTKMATIGFLVIFSLAMNLADPFEGKTWNIKVVPDGEARKAGEKDYNDAISFKGGKFTSKVQATQGFKPVEYSEDTTRFGPAKFTVQATSDSAGTAKWTGTVTELIVQGELIVTKKDGKTLTFSYSGERSDR